MTNSIGVVARSSIVIPPRHHRSQVGALSMFLIVVADTPNAVAARSRIASQFCRNGAAIHHGFISFDRVSFPLDLPPVESAHLPDKKRQNFGDID